MTEGMRSTFKEYYQKIYTFKESINILKGFSYNLVSKFKESSIDLLWLDADHSYEACKNDIRTWLPKVKSKGFFLFHDYARDFINGVRKAVDEKINTGELKKISIENSLLVTQKL